MRTSSALASFAAHMRGCRLVQACSSAEEGVRALPAAAPAALRCTLLNAHGLVLHLLDDTATAHTQLSAAVQVATSAAAAGEGGHDSYLDIGGALSDVCGGPPAALEEVQRI
jgi:hypothetical protein